VAALLPLLALPLAGLLAKLGAWPAGVVDLGTMSTSLGTVGMGLAVLLALPAAAACAFMLGFAGAGKSVPASLPVLLAGVPWLIGVAVAALEEHQVETVMIQIGSGGAGAVAAGLAEAALPRLAGAIPSAALLSAVGLALAGAALGQGAPGRRWGLGAALGFVAALPALAFALLAAVRGGLGFALPVVAATALVLGAALAGAGAGGDAPRLRSAAMAAAAPVALGAGFVAAAHASRDRAVIEVLRGVALTGSWPSEASAQIGEPTRFATLALVPALVPAAAILAWTFARTRPHAPRWVGAAALALVAALLIVPALLGGTPAAVLERLAAARPPAGESALRPEIAQMGPDAVTAPPELDRVDGIAPPPPFPQLEPGVPGLDHGGVPGGLPGPARIPTPRSEVPRVQRDKPDRPASSAGSAETDEPLRVGGDVQPPRVISRVQPRYTAEARAARIQGIVIIETIVDRQGNVGHVRVLKGLPMGLDRAAATAVEQWKFEPATLHGKPVNVYFILTVNFKVE
jgi:protein TonB